MGIRELSLGAGRLHYKLLKTGQTTKYVDGDDGDLEIGGDKEYGVLTTGQYAGTTNITINGKTDAHSNNVVRDLKTGLEWSRYVSASVGPASDGKLPWTTTGSGATAEGIYPYKDAANLSLLGGYSDWRIPNNKEFGSLFVAENVNPALNTTAFPTVGSKDIWSSTTFKSAPTDAWLAVTGTGYLYPGLTKTDIQYCWLVRGG